MKDRLEGNDTALSSVAKLAEGNPGAISVLIRLLKEGDRITDCPAFFNLLHLDSYRIYGPRIWMLYKEVCGEDLATMIGMLRAVQLGIMSEHKLHYAIDHRGDGLDVKAVLAEVKSQLPNFTA